MVGENFIFCWAMAFVVTVDGRCNGASKFITTGSDGIQSPNFGKENGESANCSWTFTISNERALILIVTKLKIYALSDGDKLCTESYNLSFNGRKVQCDRYVNHPTTASFCNAFYSTSACSEISEVKSCESPEFVNSSVAVKYEADGKLYGNREKTHIWGFEANYEFVKCPSNESVAEVTKITSTEIQQTTIVTNNSTSTESSGSIPIIQTAVTDSSLSTLMGISSAYFTSATTPRFDDEKPTAISLPLIAGVCAAGGILLISVIILLTVCLRKRNNNQVNCADESGLDDVNETSTGSGERNSNSSTKSLNPSNDDDAMAPYYVINNVAVDGVEECAYETMQDAKASTPDETYARLTKGYEEESSYSRLDFSRATVATVEPSPIDEEINASKAEDCNRNSCDLYASIDTDGDGMKTAVRYGKQTVDNETLCNTSTSCGTDNDH